jgi:lipoate---protein ligase
VVVLGSSNQPDVEVQVNNCQRDGIPILKRYGGGGTVLLYDGCVIVSLGLWVRQHYQNKLYFECLNQAVIEALGRRWSIFLSVT